jgi:PAS domain S-box-containing protein
MIWQYSPYFIPFIACGLILAILGITGWRNRTYVSALPFALLMFAASLWSFCTALELASADLPTQMLAITLEYPAIVIVPVAWLLFVLEYTGREHWLTRRNIALLCAIPLFTVIMVATNSWHHLYYTSVSEIVSGGLSFHSVTYGPAFWLHGLYSYLLIYIAIMLVFQRFVFTSTLYRGQMMSILVAALVPFFVNLAFVLRQGSLTLVDPTPFAFLISGFVVLVGMMRYQLLDITPIAQDQIIDNMSDGVVVVDLQGRIISLNIPAERVIGIPRKKAVGTSLGSILPCPATGPVTPADLPQAPAEQVEEIERTIDGIRYYFELRCIPVFSQGTVMRGRLIMIRDITEQKAAEAALSQARKKLNLLSSITRHDILNQVTGLLLSLDNAKDEVTDPVMREWLDRQEVSILTIQHQIEFARDYEKLGVKSPQWMSPHRILTDLHAVMGTHGISFRSSAGAVEIFADPLLERVFYNFLDNSIRHGGHVSLVTLSYTEQPGGMILRYGDDGVGVPDGQKERIFERGVGKNTGLGLFLVKEILEITGMTVREAGTSGSGVCFEIHVPEGKYRFIR